MAKKASEPGKVRKVGGRIIGPEGPCTVVTASVPGTLAERLDEHAKREGITRSAAVAKAIRQLLSS